MNKSLQYDLAEAIALAINQSPSEIVWEAEAGKYDRDGHTWVFVNVVDPHSDDGSYQLRLDLAQVGWLDEGGAFHDEKPGMAGEGPPNFTPDEIATTGDHDPFEAEQYDEFPDGEFGNEETRLSRQSSDPRELAEIDDWIERHCD